MSDPTISALIIARAWLVRLIDEFDIDPDITTLNINVLGPEPTRTIAKANLTESLERIDAALTAGESK